MLLPGVKYVKGSDEITNSANPDQTEQSDLNLHCLCSLKMDNGYTNSKTFY